MARRRKKIVFARPSWTKLTLLVLGFPLALTTGLWFFGTHEPFTDPNFFSRNYPASESLREELYYLRTMDRLKHEDELTIQQTLTHTSSVLNIPEPILWCLFFQESRLNHLLGIGDERTSYGLGQFTYFGFYEINYQLHQFNREGKQHLIELLGTDIRPIGPTKTELFNPSSYYYIPTAVVTSALFLKDRNIQLQRALARQNISFDPEVLWLFSVMAYNKGSRAVFSLWNQERQRSGQKGLKRLLQSKTEFLRSLEDSALFHTSLGRIWSEKAARGLAHELLVHMRNITACAVEPQVLRSYGGSL